MRHIKKSGITALTAAIALSLGAIPAAFTVPSILDVRETQTIAPATVPTSTLNLTTTSSQGTVSWNGQTQSFTGGQQCKITPTGGYSGLLGITGSVGSTPGSAGFKNGSIGVFEFTADDQGPANASQCFRVDADSFTPSETLTLTLGADVTDTFGALVAKTATVTIVAQSSGGTVEATLLGAGNALDADPVVRSWRKLKAGDSIPLTLPTTGGPYDGISLKATAGSFSLRGATFDLISQADAFFCTGGSDFYQDVDANLNVEYLGNADGSVCVGFGIQLGRADDARVRFIKPLDVDPEAQFIFEVPWDIVPLPEPVGDETLTFGSALPPATIDFEVPNSTTPPHEMPYCPDYLFEGGVLIGLPEGNSTARTDLESRDMEPDLDGVLQTVGIQFACIGDRDAKVTKATSGEGFDVAITDRIYLIGDAKMRL